MKLIIWKCVGDLSSVLQITDLLADFGGQVGLWLGLSALTIFEIVELFGDIMLLAVRKHQGKMLQKKMIAAAPDREDISVSQKTISTVAENEHEFFQQTMKEQKRALKEINEAWY